MFNPENVIYYNAPWTPQQSPDRERHQQWVRAQDYDQLLEQYNLLLAAEPARVVPFKDGYWVFAKEYSFFTKRPENGQKLKYPDKVGSRPPNYKGHWR